jgi:hypothetical protein
MRVAGRVVPLRSRPPRLARAVRAPPARTGTEGGLPLLAAARSRAPLRLALARIAARLVATRAWERLGFARLADYARERTGLSARQLQDLARTSARVEGLPALEAALLSGRLGWSQARLVARVATREDEERWIGFARRVRVRELEHAVRAVDRGSLEGGALAASEVDEDGCEPGLKVGVILRCTPAVRGKFNAIRGVARRVAGEKLPVWACMEAVAAEVLSVLPYHPSEDGDECRGSAAGEAGASWVERVPGEAGGALADRIGSFPEEVAPELADVCANQGRDRIAPFLDGLEQSDAFEVDARLRRAVAMEQRLDAELAPLAGVVSPEWLGISPRKARALRRIERAAERCPELRVAFHSGRLSWVQVEAILPVLIVAASRQERARWIERAERVSVRRLEDDVDLALHAGRQTCAQSTTPGAASSSPVPEPETERISFAAPLDVARLFRAVLCTVRRHLERAGGRLPSEGGALEWMIEHAYRAWGANAPRVRREHLVFERDGWRCTVPGCSSGSAPDRLVFELGLRPGREPLLRYGPGEALRSRARS